MSSSSTSHVRIQLSPNAGFCLKTTTLTPVVLPPFASADFPPPSSAKSNNERLEPPSAPVPIPTGRKVFVNIAWDSNVPPPPEGTDEDVRRAMEGADEGEEAQGGWYVPVIVSNAREDVDKAGKPSLVFDCIYNNGVKARTLRYPDFKTFLVELALQRIEVQTGLALSRAIATPNIASKGKLLPRTVTIPAALLHQNVPKPLPVDPETSFASIAPSGSKNGDGASASKSACSPLIQEISNTTLSLASAAPKSSISGSSNSTSTSLPGLKGILKKSAPIAKSGTESKPGPVAPPITGVDSLIPPQWDWTKDDKGRLRIEIKVSGLTTPLISASELDVDPRRIKLRIPNLAPLDIDLAPSDAEIVSRVSSSYAVALHAVQSQLVKASTGKERNRLSEEEGMLERMKQTAVDRTLRLKRQRDFDVDGADAEWKVGEGELVVYV